MEDFQKYHAIIILSHMCSHRQVLHGLTGLCHIHNLVQSSRRQIGGKTVNTVPELIHNECKVLVILNIIPSPPYPLKSDITLSLHVQTPPNPPPTLHTKIYAQLCHYLLKNESNLGRRWNKS